MVSQPYMDVTTLRNSSALSRRNTEDVPHTSLLREPVTVPYMAHVEVDSPEKLRDSCLFYPTGGKNQNMRRTIENSLRQSKNFTVEKYEVALIPKKRRPKPVEAVPHPRSQLFFGRGKLTQADREIKNLISRSREVESRLDRTLSELEAVGGDTTGDP